MKCEIIADIGINHNGNINKAKRMILEACKTGVDVVKFQLYNPKKLLHPKNFLAKNWETILNSELTKEQVVLLKAYCDKIGIEFMASAFDLERLQWLEDLNVVRHKIASRSIYDIEYVETIKKIGKPHIISMGWVDKCNNYNESYYDLWKRLGKDIYYGNNDNVNFLYCISKYPTYNIDLKSFPNKYDYYDGFSDHTLTIDASKVAIARGARIIEKHYTFNKYSIGPDHYCSMDTEELKELVRFRNFMEKM